MIWVELLLGTIMTIIHFYSEFFYKKIHKHHEELLSFSAGLFITLIFVFLLPEFFIGKEILGNDIFVLLISGFVVFHLSEKYIYQHIKNKNRLMKDLAELHAIGFFIDHFVVGMALVFAFSSSNELLGIIVFFPLLLHTFASSLSLTHIDTYFKNNQLVNLALSTAPLIGIICAELLSPEKAIYHAVFSFILGGLLYVTIRDMLPHKEIGKPRFFLAGFGLGLIFFILSNALMLI